MGRLILEDIQYLQWYRYLDVLLLQVVRLLHGFLLLLKRRLLLLTSDFHRFIVLLLDEGHLLLILLHQMLLKPSAAMYEDSVQLGEWTANTTCSSCQALLLNWPFVSDIIGNIEGKTGCGAETRGRAGCLSGSGWAARGCELTESSPNMLLIIACLGAAGADAGLGVLSCSHGNFWLAAGLALSRRMSSDLSSAFSFDLLGLIRKTDINEIRVSVSCTRKDLFIRSIFPTWFQLKFDEIALLQYATCSLWNHISVSE